MQRLYTIHTRSLKGVAFLFILCLLSSSGAFAQCANNNTLWAGGGANLIPTCANQSFQTYAGTYVEITVVAGHTYQFSSCGSPWDTQLTGYFGSSSTAAFFNDDAGGACTSCTSPSCNSGTNPSNLIWTSTFSGTLRLLVDRFSCLACGNVNDCESWGLATVTYSQFNNLSITSSGADMISGETRILTATPVGGAFGGTGVLAGVFTAPNVSTPTNFTIAYQFGSCISTQTITVSPATTYAVCQNATIELNANGMATLSANEVDGGSSSPTGSPSLSVTPNTFDCNDIGSNIMVTLTATNAGGTDNCMATVNVIDNTPPVPQCNNPTVQLNIGGLYTLTQTDVFTGGMDNCSVGLNVTSFSPQTVDCADANTIVPVTVTVNDGNGNTATCTSNVLVIDDISPVANCNNTTTVSLPFQGSYVLSPGDVFYGGLDNCNLVSFVSMCPAQVNCNDAGTVVMVEVIAQDDSGRYAICTAEVTVEDNLAPFPLCNNPMVSLNSQGTYTLTESDVLSGGLENCGMVNFVSVSPSIVNCSNAGSTVPVTVTVNDGNGNTGTCTSNVMVIDDTTPIPLCNNPTIQLDGDGTYTLTGADLLNGGTDNCNTINFVSASPSTVNCTDINSNVSVVVTVDDGNTTSTCTSTLTVVENTPPIPFCNNLTVNLGVSGTYTLTEADVFNGWADNCPGEVSFVSVSPSSVDCNDAGTSVSATVTAIDGSGNTGTCTAIIMVVDDYIAPAQCNNPSVALGTDGSYTFTGNDLFIGGTDNCGALSFTSASPAIVDCNDAGTTVPVTVTISDNNGLTTSCVANVAVFDNTPPIAACLNSTVFLQPSGTYPLNLNEVYDASNSSDNCGISSVTFSPMVVDCDDEGLTIPVVVTALNPSGNAGTCTANVTVNSDNTFPDEWDTADIGQGANNAYSYSACSTGGASGAFTITGSGNNTSSTTSDNVAFLYQDLCGSDLSITAKIESVSPNGYAGLMIRESSVPGAKQVSLFGDLSNLLRHEARYATNGPKQVNSFYKPSPIWLRLIRQGDWIFAYYSSDGTSFGYVHGVYAPMQNCLQLGMASFTYIPGTPSDGVFSNVSVTGTPSTTGAPNPINSTSLTNETQARLIPNPASNVVNLIFDEPFERSTSVILRNQSGQAIEQRQIQPEVLNTEWDVGHLANGLYFFEVHNADGSIDMLRLVKTR